MLSRGYVKKPTSSAGKTRDNIAEFKNYEYYLEYYNRLKLIALNRFEWKNLPSSCNEKDLELRLYQKGKIGFYYDDTLGLIHAPITSHGLENMYGEPISYTLTSVNGIYTKTVDADDIVIVHNNLLDTPTFSMLQIYAERLAHIDRVIDININAQKTPIIVAGDSNTISSLEAFIDKYDNNTPFITVEEESYNENQLKVLNTQAPYISDKLDEQKKSIWNEAMSFLGINNVSINKKERLITDEAQANNEIIEEGSDLMLKWREKACEELNEKYGLNISVVIRKNESYQNYDDLYDFNDDIDEEDDYKRKDK